MRPPAATGSAGRGAKQAKRRPSGGSQTSPARRELVAEVAAQRETLLQACWAHRHWRTARLSTREGLALEVVEPGWLNRGPGPDFTEARLLIGGTEHWGDVEVHMEEREWWDHRHDRDPGYARVILHVVLRGGGGPATLPISGTAIPVLEAAPYIPADLPELSGEGEALLRQYENLPGRCGLRALASEPEALSRVVAHAAETRARAKAERLAPALEVLPEEQVLFEQIFSYLGYRPFAELFHALARRFQLDALRPLLALPNPQARTEVLARWFGSAGLLGRERAGCPDPLCQSEYDGLRRHWLSLGLEPVPVPLRRGGSRPWNSPERRMVGMFHHLYGLERDGWMKGWLGLLRDLDALRDRPNFRRSAVAALERLFATPPQEPWRNLVSLELPSRPKGAQLIGADRVTVLMANAVLPFFLALARRRPDPELEKVLYRLYLVLPPEAPNQRIRFMEKRLTPLVPLHPTLRTHQGLLQIHQDFCISFHQGCERCGFPDLIAPPRPRSPEEPAR